MTNPKPTVRIGSQAYQKLKELSARSGEAMLDILDRAVEAERRRWFVEQANVDYEALRPDEKRWAGTVAERANWDATLADGLDTPGQRRGARKSGTARRRKNRKQAVEDRLRILQGL